MYAVIFRATIQAMDEQYIQTAQHLRHVAMTEYHCVDFHACTQGNQEIAISYWHSLADIAAWHRNVEHQIAQQNGLWKWYKSCQLEITEIVRQYERSNLS